MERNVGLIADHPAVMSRFDVKQKGSLVSVNPGNRALRAVVGFGAGEATTEVNVEVDRLESETSVPLLRFGTQAESAEMPGGAVTLNPYVMAAKFVLGRQATTRDVEAMGKEIAKQIADYARSRRLPSSTSVAQRCFSSLLWRWGCRRCS